ncbi:MAG: MarR family winged helix-turn-helix transcriptional regulator [Acidimicrobiales bacterium]
MDEVRWLDAEEDRIWRSWIAMADLLRTQLSRDLLQETGLSGPDYAVLVNLSEAPGGRLRMSDLAESLCWSKSRLSHQVARMGGRGLVAREGCSSDARSTYAVLTPCGRQEINRAAPLHVASVRQHLFDLLDARQLGALGEVTEAVVNHLRASAPKEGFCAEDGVGTCD